jgi:hypothetical protein
MMTKRIAHLPIRRLVTIVSLLLIVIGAVALLLPQLRFYIERTQGQHANSVYWHAHEAVKPPQTMELGVPVAISLQRLHINLGIVPGRYAHTTQKWLLDRTHAFYILPGTAPLNANAVPLIYGHDIPAVFEDLGGIAPGEVMTIKNNKGAILTFRYVNEDVVNPDEGAELNSFPNDHKTINVLTCTGEWFTQRRIMHFEYVSSSLRVGANT